MEEKDKILCWWDMERCRYYSEIKGFQDARGRCAKCWRIDQERFRSILEELAPGFFEKEIKEAIEEAREEGRREIKEALVEEAHIYNIKI